MTRFRKITETVLFVFLVVVGSTSAVCGSNGEIDTTSNVIWIVDGDTFDISSGERIRLADVDTPEQNESGYYNAKDFMIDTLHEKTVYLDIDDITVFDTSGTRIVCVVYVEHNFTHYMNVNKALLEYNYAVERNHTNNEFKPSDWTLYVQKDVIPEFSAFATLPILFAVSVLSIYLRKRSRKTET